MTENASDWRILILLVGRGQEGEPLRTQLAERNGKRGWFTATFARYGIKHGRWSVDEWGMPKRTVLLVDVRDEGGNPVADHLWFNLTQGFEDACLSPGDRVRFRARVKPYMKGYSETDEDRPFTVDYKLSYPTNVEWICPDEDPDKEDKSST